MKPTDILETQTQLFAICSTGLESTGCRMARIGCRVDGEDWLSGLEIRMGLALRDRSVELLLMY